MNIFVLLIRRRHNNSRYFNSIEQFCKLKWSANNDIQSGCKNLSNIRSQRFFTNWCKQRQRLLGDNLQSVKWRSPLCSGDFILFFYLTVVTFTSIASVYQTKSSMKGWFCTKCPPNMKYSYLRFWQSSFFGRLFRETSGRGRVDLKHYI